MNIALTVSYLGSAFHGWQIQPNKPSVQEVLQNCLQQIFNQPIVLHGSGRTDAGVSALGQVANFHVNQSDVNCYRLQQRLNAMLPNTVRVLKCEEVPQEFHARFSVKKKTYAYHFYQSPVAIPYYDTFATQMKQPFNLEVLKTNLQMVVGTHDFSSFCASNTQTENKVRQIYSAQLEQHGEVFSVVITGNGFLYNMVRILMGTLFDIALGKINQTVLQILEQKDRTKAGKTASQTGLVLVEVCYN